jgi:hypothetical protein
MAAETVVEMVAWKAASSEQTMVDYSDFLSVVWKAACWEK